MISDSALKASDVKSGLLESIARVTNIATRVRMNSLTATQLRDRVRDILEGSGQQAEGSDTFAARFLAYADRAKAANTRAIYLQTYRRLQAYCPCLDDLAFEDITSPQKRSNCFAIHISGKSRNRIT